MKKLSLLFVVAMFFVAGCAIDQGQPQIQINPDSQAAIARITARHVGFEVQKQYPDIATKILLLSKGILEENASVKTIFDQIVTMLTSEIKNDLIAMDIKDIIGLIKVEPNIKITPGQIELIKSIAKGLIQGIEGQTIGDRACNPKSWYPEPAFPLN